ncbi:2',3'-cyclic-nucleotide 2'-phosphodiesterase [Lentibacillus populi]|uniref:2',3'-cyclic-nucleotide 2'-phosphodiesterase n=1 Tax=Lentibacillus populi TaxID=1827502 RepID=A0A9W5U083_9BACI|nr:MULTISPECIES: bifunctional 2',3'-cyclic-nucleotide 2'-phosphodiesterase/3'-nucleotidase [Bacillaceae]MBT2216876.1 bifunctional 2',3'-cyclic-nucleotide 2'-phosphodiesterase/3'-nucleotidase [Virgibacillus dakarensis]GGB52289.1 2',3'-cyclic-nucleotide 2'-phosphodiesterase [Lentibacillus populi]
MGIRKTGKIALMLLAALLVSIPLSNSSADAEEAGEGTVDLRLMETTDIHVHLANYDYYQDKETNEFGLAMTATLIKKSRSEVNNSMLFDNGDLIQGNPLGDYIAQKGLEEGEVHPVYKAMNLLDYDAANIGNHEFNYGIDYLKEATDDANFPYVNANVYYDDGDDDPTNDQPFFEPYKILPKQVVDSNGNTQTINVGIIGFVPPQIMQWDKTNLEGKVITKDIYKTAQKYIPEMKEQGADIIVAIPHSGLGSVELKEREENATYNLTEVEGIDAIMFGHAHEAFPSETFAGIPGVNLEKGTLNGVPSVEAGFWGNHLGIIDLKLQQNGDSWEVIDSSAEVQAIYDENTGEALVEADQGILDAISEDHQATLDYIRSQVGETTAPIYSYFALVKDDPSVQIVANAQKWYTEQAVKETEYEGLPILSAAAPFKAGGRGGAGYYTYIPEGPIAIKNVADLYVYPNTLKVVKINGEQVREWLEMAAGQFNQIDPNASEEQSLVNNDFPTYNFDVIDGVTYKIDVTEPTRYNRDGELINPEAHRIVNLQYNGEAVQDDQEFLVATNNYRAGGGGNFPNLDGSQIVLSPQAENRQVVIDYIQTNGTIDPSADSNWSFAPIEGNAQLTFQSSPDAQQFIQQDGNIAYLGEGTDGFAKYALDLSEAEETVTLSSIKQDVADYVQSGDINHPLAVKLTNKLKQAEHQLNKGHHHQAVKKMEGFLKHLNKKAMDKFITKEAKEGLNNSVEVLLNDWRNN